MVALKKAYSTFSQAYISAVQENGTPDNWTTYAADAGGAAAKDFMDKLVPYLKINKNCGIDSGCFPSVTYKTLYGSNNFNYDSSPYVAKIQLSDGKSVYTGVYDPACVTSKGSSLALQNTCANIVIDVNGNNAPNQIGKDLFNFYIGKNGIVPVGIASAASGVGFSDFCKDISLSTTTGWGCTAWVIYNENMDYLHCSDLAWDGKHKCS